MTWEGFGRFSASVIVMVLHWKLFHLVMRDVFRDHRLAHVMYFAWTAFTALVMGIEYFIWTV